MDKINFIWTGNPFVDTGWTIITHLAKKDDISELNIDDVKKVLNDTQKNVVEWNSKLKSFTMVFGTNNSLYQAGYGYKKGKGPSDRNKKIYRMEVSGLLDAIEKDSNNGYICESCGATADFDFAAYCKNVFSQLGEKLKEGKTIGRDWFPLSGSLGSDAQSLPAASRSMNICPKCLFAIHYLPIGLILLGGRPAIFQSTSKLLTMDLVGAIVDETISRLNTGNYETIGKGEGTKVLVNRLLKLFEDLQKSKKQENLPQYSNLLVWRFSNSGTGADCQLEKIPNQALQFLWEAVRYGLRSEVEKLLSREPKDPRKQLLTAIKEGRDYFGLYSYKKFEGAKPELYTLYQMRICGVNRHPLMIAQKIATEFVTNMKPKEIEKIKAEIFRDKSNRSKALRIMSEMAEKNELSLADYSSLFPEIGKHPIQIDWRGWDIIRYFLKHSQDENWKEKYKDIGGGGNVQQHPLIKRAAELYFEYYVKEKGIAKFKNNILDAFKHNKIGRRWLETVFLRLAEKGYDGFQVSDWDDFCNDENGNPCLYELLFQMRLHLANLYGQKIKKEGE